MKWRRRITFLLVLCILVTVVDINAKMNDQSVDLLETTKLNQGEKGEIDWFIATEITQEEAKRIPTYDRNTIKAKAKSVNGYHGEYGYDLLETKKEKEAYKKLEEASIIFNNSYNNAEEITYSSGNKGYLAFRVSLEELDLDKEEVGTIVVSFIYDNPQFFWTKGYSFSYRQTTNSVVDVCLACSDDYRIGPERIALKEKMERRIESYLDQVARLKSDYEKELMIHDTLASNLSYAYDSSGKAQQERWAHTIVGAFDDKYDSVVCEGYAKAFQLLLNACGIENIYIVGEAKTGGSWQGHAWNQVKIQGEWYNVDLTWNDGTNGYTHQYFNVTDHSFSTAHKPYGQEEPVVGAWCYQVKSCTENLYSYTNQGPIQETGQTKIIYQQPEQGKLLVLNQGVEVVSGTSVKKGCNLDVVFNLENHSYSAVFQYFMEEGGEWKPIYEVKKENQMGQVKVPLETEKSSITIIVTIELDKNPTKIPENTVEPNETESPLATAMPQISNKPTVVPDDNRIEKLSKKVKFKNVSIYQGEKIKINMVKPSSLVQVKMIKDNQFGERVNGAYLMQVCYRIQNSKIANVDTRTGIIWGKKSGNTNVVVTVLYSNGYSKKYIIKVKIKKPYITMNSKKIKLRRKEVKKISVKKYGVKGVLRWYSANKKIAYVNRKTGKIIGKKKGSTYIYAKIGAIGTRCKIIVN